MYDFVFVTQVPAFYKINLYNEIAKSKKILVIFIASGTMETRSEDFLTVENANFPHQFLSGKALQNRDVFKNIFLLLKILRKISFKKVIVGGWDLSEFWLVFFFTSKKNFALALESTIIESKFTGVAGLIKKIFLWKTSTVFASGLLHRQLLEALNFKGEIRITKGVGLINKPVYISSGTRNARDFLYVGRLSSEKNLTNLIAVFNEFPDLRLTVIGAGPLLEDLKGLAKGNIRFLGSIANKDLHEYYLESSFLILPSSSEPWGLVVEEALYFGLPVIVSSNCGSSQLVAHGANGFLYDGESLEDMKSALIEACSVGLMSAPQEFTFFINEKDKDQVAIYE